MSGICGWCGQPDQGFDAGDALDKMEKQLGAGTRATPFSGEQWAAAGRGRKVQLASTDETIVILHGEPAYTGHMADNIAETIANAYRHHGADVLSNIHGAFSLVILDLRDHSALLAVDRSGIEPLCYGIAGNMLMFASRADCLSAHPRASSDIDPQSIFNYLYFHCIPSPRSIFKQQHKLLPGQMVQYRNGQADASFYWQLEFQDKATAFEPLGKECFSLLEQAVNKAAGEDNPGAFLSGGIDSSTVSGLLARHNTDTTKTYTMGFEAQGYDEMEFARLTAKHFNLKPVEYYVTPRDVVDAIPLIAQAYDEPFGNASAVPTYYCAKLAAEDGQSVLLAGDGGDEIFAGNERYAHQLLLEQYQRIPTPLRKLLIEPLTLNFPGHAHIPPLRKLGSYINQANAPLPDRMETYNFLNRTPLDEIFTQDFLEPINTDEPLMSLRDTYQGARTASTLNRMLHLDLKITLADNDLRKVNRMCELAGIDVRYPMLDDNLVEFSGRVPPALKLRHLKLRYFVKRTLKDFLPQQALTKSKQGFGLPFGVWMREDKGLRDITVDSLNSFKKRGYVNTDYIDTLLRLQQDEHASYYGVMLWVMMMLEQWLQAHSA
jgi:asparagine synthase (glutamine-hydrolysing)